MNSFSGFVSLCDIPFGGLLAVRYKMPGSYFTSWYVSASSACKMSHVDANAEFELLCDNPTLPLGLVCGI